MSKQSRLQSRQVQQAAKPQVLPAPTHVRRGARITTADGQLAFLGTCQRAGQTIRSVSAARRWVRQQRFPQFALRVEG